MCSRYMCVSAACSPLHANPVDLGKPANETVLWTCVVLIDFHHDFFPLRQVILIRLAPRYFVVFPGALFWLDPVNLLLSAYIYIYIYTVTLP